MSATFNYYTPKPEGDWVGFKAQMELSGSHHASNEVNGFIKATRALKAGVEDPIITVVRENDNAFDRNALRVDATWDGKTWKLGYMPREFAAEISKKYSLQMPIAASLLWVRYAGNGLYVKVHFHIPGNKTRKDNGWNLSV